MMKQSTKIILVALLLAIPALALGRIIWPDAPEIVQPSSRQMPWFVLLATVEALAFGFGMTFLIFGWPMVAKLRAKDPEKMALFLSITWLLASWWPHDNMHRHNGMDIAGLLGIEYIFHFTLIVAAGIVAWSFWRALPSPEA